MEPARSGWIANSGGGEEEEGRGEKEEGFSNFTKGEKERNEINGGGIIDSAQDIINKLVV